MAEPDVPDAVRSLLRDRIGSYEELEILLLLARSPTAAFTVDEVGAGVRTTAPVAAGALERLRTAGLVHRDGDAAYRYRPNGPADGAVEALVLQTRDNPIAIIRLMSANAIERIRMSAVQAFADAFVLGRDGDRTAGDTTDG